MTCMPNIKFNLIFVMQIPWFLKILEGKYPE